MCSKVQICVLNIIRLIRFVPIYQFRMADYIKNREITTVFTMFLHEIQFNYITLRLN